MTSRTDEQRDRWPATTSGVPSGVSSAQVCAAGSGVPRQRGRAASPATSRTVAAVAMTGMVAAATSAAGTAAATSAATSGAGTAAEVRLHAPAPGVVVVRVMGRLDPRGVELLVDRVRFQSGRARHVVIEFADVETLDPAAAASLTALPALADRRGSRLHWAAVHDGVRAQLQHAGLATSRQVAISADAALATLTTPPGIRPHPRSSTPGADGRSGSHLHRHVRVPQ